MSSNEILDKLASFLSSHKQLSEECEVVYLLVEIRKIIDQSKANTKYPLLKFYSDWTVHSKKDRITAEMEKLSEDMYTAAVAAINAPYGLVDGRSAITAFAYMDALGKEVKAFLSDHGLDQSLAVTEERWVDFVSLLVKILENQPIINPSKNVEKILFEPANERCVIAVIIFKQPVNGKGFYRYGNAF